MIEVAMITVQITAVECGVCGEKLNMKLSRDAFGTDGEKASVIPCRACRDEARRCGFKEGERIGKMRGGKKT